MDGADGRAGYESQTRMRHVDLTQSGGIRKRAPQDAPSEHEVDRLNRDHTLRICGIRGGYSRAGNSLGSAKDRRLRALRSR